MEKKKYEASEFLLDESFQRYVLQKDEEDVKYWVHWIQENPEAIEAIEIAREIISFTQVRKSIKKHPEIKEQVFKAIQTKINAEEYIRKKYKKNIRIKIYWYAASLVFVVGFTIGFYQYNKIKKTNKPLAFLEVIVPKGQRSQLLLPDNTKVWLNAGTVFRYPQNFGNNKKRSVFLEGEAFFHVQHNKNIPFYVNLKENLSIKVTGTEFNIKCYANEKTIETTLVKGSINLIQQDHRKRTIKEIELQPNERASYNKKDNKIVITKLLPDIGNNNIKITSHSEEIQSGKISSIIAWKEEELVFDDETFYDIAVKMERWFGIAIKIQDENLKKERFTGKFGNNETVYQILDIINRTEPINYKVLNNEIIIMSKRKNNSNN